jgi:hypothetical protein
MPLFEAVVNSIHAIAEVSDSPAYGKIIISIRRRSFRGIDARISITWSG